MYPKLGGEQFLDHPHPSLGQIAPVIAPAPERQHPPVLQPIGQCAQIACRLRVRRRGQQQVRQRVARDAVSPALQDQELRLKARHMRQHRGPHLAEVGVARARGQGHVELGASGGAAAHLRGVPGARIQRLAALVQVGDDDFRIILEGR